MKLGTIVKMLAVTLLIALAGCSQIEAKIQADVAKLTLPDVDNALALATAHNNVSGVTCWGWWSATMHAAADVVTSDGTPAPAPVIGIATLLELGSETEQNPTSFALPKMPRAVHDACAGVILDDKALLAKFGFVAGNAALGVGNLQGAAQLRAGAAALRAASAAVHP